MELQEIEEEIKKYASNCICKKVYIKSANKSFLCVYFINMYHRIQLHDKENGLNCVAKIDYALNGRACYIDLFETLPNYQGLGLGKFIFNLALAHADNYELTNAYGFISPTNEIKGVVSEDYSLENETKTLVDIYKKLGATVDDEGFAKDIVFNLIWQEGERNRFLTKQQKEFINQIVELNNIKNVGI